MTADSHHTSAAAGTGANATGAAGPGDHAIGAAGPGDNAADPATLQDADQPANQETHDEAVGDDHGHAQEALGRIDLAAWGASLLGLALGLAIAVCFMLATARPA